jgi:hypothetical protein
VTVVGSPPVPDGVELSLRAAGIPTCAPAELT